VGACHNAPMTTARVSAAPRVRDRSSSRSGPARLVLSFATAVSVLGLALLLLLMPVFMHPALDAAGAPVQLGLSAFQAHALSDRTVAELLLGPGTFTFAGPDGTPFYDGSEAGHLRDVRLVLYGFLVLAALSLGGVVLAAIRGRSDPQVWMAVARGGAGLVATVAVLGIFAVLAFNVAFELFHRLLFPGGNWQFDPGSQRLVQLYPLAFWQLTAAAMGVLAVSGGLVVWVLARRRGRRLERR
jgi:integral membrane protein (TIGR01906 family)